MQLIFSKSLILFILFQGASTPSATTDLVPVETKQEHGKRDLEDKGVRMMTVIIILK